MRNLKLTRIIAVIIMTTFILTPASPQICTAGRQSGIAMMPIYNKEKAQNLRAKATGETNVAGAVAEALAVGNKDRIYRAESNTTGASAAGDVQKALEAIESIITRLNNGDSNACLIAQYKLTAIIGEDNLTQNSEIQKALAQAIPVLADNFSHKNRDVRWGAQKTFTAIAKSDNLTQSFEIQTAIATAMSALIADSRYKNSDSNVRWGVEYILIAITKSDNLTQNLKMQTAIAAAMPALIVTLSHENPDQKRCCLTHYILIDIAESNNLTQSSKIQKALIQAIPVLRVNLSHENDGVRRAAQATLTTITGNNNLMANPEIKTAMKDYKPKGEREAQARPAGASAVGDTALQAIQTAIPKLSDEDSDVRLDAKRILATIAGNDNLTRYRRIQTAFVEAIRVLIGYLSHENPDVRRIAHQTLTAIAESNNLTRNAEIQKALAGAMPALRDNLGHQIFDVFWDARCTLASIVESDNLTKSPEIQEAIAAAIPALRDNFKHKNSYRPWAAQTTLTTIAENNNLTQNLKIQTAILPAIPALIDNATHENSDVRQSAQDTLTAIAGSDNLMANPEIAAALPEEYKSKADARATGASAATIPGEDVRNVMNEMKAVWYGWTGDVIGFYIARYDEKNEDAFVSLKALNGMRSVTKLEHSSLSFFYKAMKLSGVGQIFLSVDSLGSESFSDTQDILSNIGNVVQTLREALQRQNNVFVCQGKVAVIVEITPSGFTSISLYGKDETRAVEKLGGRIPISLSGVSTAIPDFAGIVKDMEEFRALESELTSKADGIKSPATIEENTAVVFTPSTASLGLYHLVEKLGVKAQILTLEEMAGLTNKKAADVDAVLEGIADKLNVGSIRLCALQNENILTNEVEIVRIKPDKISSEIMDILSEFGMNIDVSGADAVKEAYDIAKQMAEWL